MPKSPHSEKSYRDALPQKRWASQLPGPPATTNCPQHRFRSKKKKVEQEINFISPLLPNPFPTYFSPRGAMEFPSIVTNQEPATFQPAFFRAFRPGGPPNILGTDTSPFQSCGLLSAEAPVFHSLPEAVLCDWTASKPERPLPLTRPAQLLSTDRSTEGLLATTAFDSSKLKREFPTPLSDPAMTKASDLHWGSFATTFVPCQGKEDGGVSWRVKLPAQDGKAMQKPELSCTPEHRQLIERSESDIVCDSVLPWAERTMFGNEHNDISLYEWVCVHKSGPPKEDVRNTSLFPTVPIAGTIESLNWTPLTSSLLVESGSTHGQPSIGSDDEADEDDCGGWILDDADAPLEDYHY